eukprot:1175683-Prorocentrum_minimum.AAC.5
MLRSQVEEPEPFTPARFKPSPPCGMCDSPPLLGSPMLPLMGAAEGGELSGTPLFGGSPLVSAESPLLGTPQLDMMGTPLPTTPQMTPQRMAAGRQLDSPAAMSPLSTAIKVRRVTESDLKRSPPRAPGRRRFCESESVTRARESSTVPAVNISSPLRTRRRPREFALACAKQMCPSQREGATFRSGASPRSRTPAFDRFQSVAFSRFC